MASWPNHDGTPTGGADDFYPPPTEIGRVLSGTSSSTAGQPINTSWGTTLFLGLLAGGVIGGLGGYFVGLQWSEDTALVAAGGAAAVLTVVTVVFLRWFEKAQVNTFVGTDGIATLTGRGDKVSTKLLRFSDAAALTIKRTTHVTNGVPTMVTADYDWLAADGRRVHREQVVLPVSGSTAGLPRVAPVFFITAVEQAWAQFQSRRR